MDSPLDAQRSLHEEIERLEQSIVKTLLMKPKSVRLPKDAIDAQHKDKVAQEHRISRLVSRIQTRSRSLLALYENEDGFAFYRAECQHKGTRQGTRRDYEHGTGRILSTSSRRQGIASSLPKRASKVRGR
jgi:hypothetical protein